MPNYIVRASVVDISRDTPKREDRVWVDTNVLYWQTYSRASLRTYDKRPKYYQTSSYPSWMQRAIRSGSTLHFLALSFAELAHLVETAEREIAEGAGQIPFGTKPKDFRHNYPSQRANVIAEITNCWQAVESLASELPGGVLADAGLISSSLPLMSQCAVDGYDLFMVEALKAAGVTQVLSDDGDFCTVAGITLFTANRNVIQAAAAQGKPQFR
jgi:hypothetical protein